MKNFLILPVLLVLPVFFLFQSGCGGDDDPGDPQPEECSLTVTAPIAGSSYLSGERVGITWNKQGTAAQVVIELLKEGDQVAVIDTVANDRYQRWTADTMGAVSGDDFALRLTALGEAGCTDTSDEFTILDVSGCNLAFTMADTAFLDAGMQYEVTWDSEHTAGSVDLELMRGDLPDDEPVGFIASNIPDSGSYLWTVDSLHQGTYDYYYLRITARDVADCSAESNTFRINDDDICEIWINEPQPGVHWISGETRNIVFTAPDPATTHVNINLYEGVQFVNNIAANVATTGAQQSVSWVVNTTGSASPGTTYRIKISDAVDQYCVGWSEHFTITED